MSNAEQTIQDIVQAAKRQMGANITQLALDLAEKGALDGLRPVLEVTLPELPSSGSSTKARDFFLQFLSVLDSPADPDAARALATDVANKLGFLKPRALEYMLGNITGEKQGARLMKFGADPNGAATKNAKSSLTPLGMALSAISAGNRTDLSMPRAMIEECARRNEIPMTNVLYEGKTSRHFTVFQLIVDRAAPVEPVDSAISTKAVMSVVAGLDRVDMPASWPAAIAEPFLKPAKQSAFDIPGRHSQLLALVSFAEFESAKQMISVFNVPTAPKSVGTSIIDLSYRDFDRLITSMVKHGVDVDSINAKTNADDIPCTLLQLAALCGKGEMVKRLLEAGADAGLKVGAQTENYQIADMDALGLWNCQAPREPCEALLAWKAKHAIESTLRKARNRP